ncbi:GAF domain-containing protein [Thermodesulfobacterium sp. TA1]|uniref:sigma-54 interaction domain-containing protein n=1 Tax=Thermodesulfobacterium sp. TA1 TaxID=2234087 RepID=UPI001232F052|nr:sigma 54-interacting transcriptional regulator [Thermodesulfobacterium sp. TA1]QER41856.1 GAF domain-containing protein [Thermodesulfobacterium sp. TA1]
MPHKEVVEQLERKNKELLALLEISKILSSSFNLQHNLYQSLKVLSDILDMKRATITLYDSETNTLHISVAYGLTPEQIKRGIYKKGEGIVGKVFDTGEPIVVPNIGKEPMFLNKTGARLTKENISFLCLPLKIEGEVLGVLSVDRIFSEDIDLKEDIRFLNIVSTLFSQYLKLYQMFKKEKEEKESLSLELKGKYQFRNLIGVSDKMQQVFKLALKAAKCKANILIIGESGTGKELIAKAIHFESDRANGPFVAINCAAIPETLLEAELFGYKKGAFTGALISKPGKFELANGGTIFLDEIGDLPLSLQAKLLRVIQEKTFERIGDTKPIKVEVRIIAATNRDLEAMIREGTFRDDLYFRLNVIPIYIPPLRERKEDIPLLVEHFLKKFNQEYNKNVQVSAEVMEKLVAYHWPGNVRELENTLERLVVLAEKEFISLEDLPFYIRQASLEFKIKREKDFQEKLLPNQIELIEKKAIEEALKACKYNQTKAAKLLGLTKRQISYRIKKYGILTE